MNAIDYVQMYDKLSERMNDFDLGIGNRAIIVNLWTVLTKEPRGHFWDRSTNLYYLDEPNIPINQHCAHSTLIKK